MKLIKNLSGVGKKVYKTLFIDNNNNNKYKKQTILNSFNENLKNFINN